jgi:hypothetical protein
MSIERLEAITSDLLLVMTAFPLLIGQTGRNRTKSKEKGERRDNN